MVPSSKTWKKGRKGGGGGDYRNANFSSRVSEGNGRMQVSSVRKMELIGPSSRDVRGKQDYGLSGMKSKRRRREREGGRDRVSCSIWNSRARRASSVYRALQGLRKIVGALER